MTTTDRRPASPDRRLALWLALGALLLALAHLRAGVGLLAWIAPLPFLRYLRLTRGVRARVWLTLALCAAWIVACAKITTAPLPAFFALPVGIGMGLLQAAGYLTWDALRARLGARGEGMAVLAFPAAMVGIELGQHRFTPLASWGAAAYSQIDDLALLQTASVAGIAGIGFLVYWVAAALESLYDARSRAAVRRVAVALGAVLAAHVFGAARLAMPVAETTTRVAMVGTLATFAGPPLPGAEERAKIEETLFADTARAAASGASLVVWTEGAHLVSKEDEPRFLARASEAARRANVHLVIAYIVPRSLEPVSFENVYRWMRPDGAIDHTYYKHHPAPGEPAVVGSGPLDAVETSFGRAGGALCYDYDYPEIAAEHGALGVDLVALPSSDWRGIDPIHTQMAALRAIEQGVSVVRSTRFGLSAAIDPRGRIRAWHSSFDGGDRVLLASVPGRGIRTVYGRFGDLLVWASAAFLLTLVARVLRGRFAAREIARA